jgi:excinuclease ABC subunit A
MVSEVIKILGAKTHNLKNIDVEIPINKLVCIAGPSGSGKSSLAFHTLALESKRRFINSLPSDVKFFWETPHQIDVEQIYPVLPVMTMPQRNPVVSSRSNVADILGVTELLQKLYFYNSVEYCPEHDEQLVKNKILTFISALNLPIDDTVHIFLHKLDYKKNFKGDQLPARSFQNGQVKDFEDEDTYWELLRLKSNKLPESLEKNNVDGLFLEHSLLLYSKDKNELFYFQLNSDLKCLKCNFSPIGKCMQLFSPYNPLGACSKCSGHGLTLEYDESRLFRDLNLSISEGGIHFLKSAHVNYFEKYFLTECKKAGVPLDKPMSKLIKDKLFMKLFYDGAGKYPGFNEMMKYLVSIRYKKTVRIFLRSIQKEVICTTCDYTRMSGDARPFKVELSHNLYRLEELLHKNIFEMFELFKQEKRPDRMIAAIKSSLETAIDLGLGHLGILRKVKSITSSEYQRLLLVKFLSFSGSGILFVLDEPTHSLALEEQEKVWKHLCKLRDQQNTIVMVEHSDFMIKNSDHLILIGPGAGINGGVIQWQGSAKKHKSEKLILPKRIPISNKKELLVKDLHSLSGEIRDFKITQNSFNWIHGTSGSGKTSIVKSFMKTLKDDEFIYVNSAYEKATSRSSVGSFSGLVNVLRKIYINLDEAKKMGLKEGHFSPNSELGMCLSCEGRGVRIVDMQFLEDLEFVCDECNGAKLKRHISKISDGMYSYVQAVNRPVLDCFKGRKLTPKFTRILHYFDILNLGHLSLDREVQSLSGGEAARLKLLLALQGAIENKIIILENVSLGLSTRELVKISTLLGDLLSKNNTVLLIDQNELFRNFAHFDIHFSRENIAFNKLY